MSVVLKHVRTFDFAYFIQFIGITRQRHCFSKQISNRLDLDTSIRLNGEQKERMRLAISSPEQALNS